MKTAEMTSLRVAEEITELVGETPVLHLRKLIPAEIGDVYAKLEYLNPGGSIKDRAALGIITDAERKGLLRPGSTIFEATAGNTGIGLALIGCGRGYKVVLAVPERFSREKVMIMEALGADGDAHSRRRGHAGSHQLCESPRRRDAQLIRRGTV